MTFARRVDANAADIIEALRRCGWYWQDTSKQGDGCPDGFAVKVGRVVPVEIKDGAKPASKQKLTPDEANVHAAFARHGVTVQIVTSVEQAMAL